MGMGGRLSLRVDGPGTQAHAPGIPREANGDPMKLDRETFLALTLSLSACSGAGHHVAPTDEAAIDKVYQDPTCTGFDMDSSPMRCVSWKGGKVVGGYTPTEECVRWNDAGNCTAKMFVKSGSHEGGE